MRKIVTVILICTLAVIACVSGYKIFQAINEYRVGETSYDDLKKYVIATSSDTESKKPEKQPFKPVIAFDELSAVNSDIVSWIRLNGSVIDYPVAQCGDNDYYLNHLFNKQVNSSGCIFLDCRNNPDFSDRNSVIYGHHMKNGSMFSAITKYKEQAFYDKHPEFQLYTPTANYKVKIFAGYVADLKDEAWNTEFDDVEFSEWIEKRIQKSLFKSKLKPSAEDRIVTLSTCSYEFENARFVIFGVVRKKG
ncbi:MAG: class B sortase [Ruminococcus sp.]|nr:class B sortase [Ruminococcus sp.]